ncbi:MAG: tetratricopeptide repeat protein [bacterium]|nr:tetratricopeptide repeat protein [bacterium]
MLGKSKIIAVFLMLLMVISLAGCSKTTNIFRWAHKGGSDTSQESLLADGQAALSSKDFSDALTYYNKLLDQNPNDSEALYGKAQALIGLGGLSLADLIANVIKEAQNNGTSPVIANSEFGAFFSKTNYASTSGDLLPESLNLPQLYHTAIVVVPILKQIADGNSNGVIPADDPDVNINLAFFMTIQAVCRLLDDNKDTIPGGTGDLVQVLKDSEGGGWSVILPDASALTLSKQRDLRDQAQAAIDDEFGVSSPESLGAVNYLEKAINKIKAKNGSPLMDLWENINDLKTSIKDQIDTNVNPKMDASIPDIVWHPRASLIQ